ncbi:LuxR C-terminal-related transcriptional regulator [Kovacikia minuta CCNUW1]|uniref:helix-turn-helix transcriptional regulator n=1 Tax=Kovacikia minuta TaxID=2931930 RepID=UPI001CC9860A|nr:helix-turn-helix transcriptional regulator [Kovacikia minuta]UBF27063.1 LuxR C-terminal-related transcriptional regulator [Kovacikia minuta CCNUW1]
MEGVYQQYLRPMGIEDEMTVILPCEQSSPTDIHSLPSRNDTVTIGLHRSQWNFSERDRTILNLLHPHLMQARQNAEAFSKHKQALAQLNGTIEQCSAVLLSSDGQVQWMTRRAWSLLVQYFQDSVKREQLPENLQRWVNHQISLQISNRNIPFPPLPLQVQQAEKRLMIRFIGDRETDQFLLLLEEDQPLSFSPTNLELLGLTKREGEILFWLARDKTKSEIAERLGCSASTVKTHLERIYKKFGVRTSTAALMHALEHLGMLNQ